MPKLYVFAIGGTGARVLRALTHLLASGLDAGGMELVPIVIDADQSNGDTRRALDALNLYRRLREGYGQEEPAKGDFFYTNVIRPNDALGGAAGALSQVSEFRLPLQNVHDRSFKEYIRLSAMSEESQAMARLLFSDTDLQADMVVGFEGRPHMGIVVLNQLPDSEYYRNFAANLKSEDRIFIIGSIFGGTGAAGLPMLVKNIRQAYVNGAQAGYLKNAPIGALVALPYYGLQDGETGKSIDGHKFRTMAKAALSYYEKNIVKDGSVNALYTIGDDPHALYANNKGGEGQTNPAHFVEVAAALAVADFGQRPSADLETQNGRALAPKVLEFGTKNKPNGHRITFDDLARPTREKIERSLVKYLLFEHYLDNYFQKKGVKITAAHDPVHFDDQFRQIAWYQDLVKFNADFASFIGELSDNKDAFHPFAITRSGSKYTANESDILSLVIGRPYKRTPIIGAYGYEVITNALRDSAARNKDVAADKAPLRFLKAFNQGLSDLLDKRKDQLLPSA